EDDEHAHGSGPLPLSKITTLEGVRAAAGYFAMDWTMIGRDIALGLVIAGSLAALVPPEWWSTLFMSPGAGEHPGLWVSLENALVGPVIAILSFVCSVGNIPLAAVLWAGGISFGGVIAFIYADLITIPMVLVYRRYYGWRPALAYAALLLLTMVLVALMVDAAFRAIGLAPAPGTGEGMAERSYFAWDYTTFLNLVFLPLGIGLFALGRRAQGDGGHG
ncbi:MAG: permease, partial [Myxococcota bacterium]|nr:permease [Myxococcota bacterium]